MTAETDLAPPLRVRYRIRFEKRGLLRWISHRDLARLWERMLRRAAFALSMTEGFHPKPRIGFPSALALGVDGLDEVVEIELSENLSPADVLNRLESDEQPGLHIRAVCKVPEGYKKPQLKHSEYRISIPDGLPLDEIETAIERLQGTPTVTVQRKKKSHSFVTKEQILTLECEARTLKLILAASDSATLRPHDVLELLGYDNWVDLGSHITRNRVVLQSDVESLDQEVIAISARNQQSTETNPKETP